MQRIPKRGTRGILDATGRAVRLYRRIGYLAETEIVPVDPGPEDDIDLYGPEHPAEIDEIEDD
jgi:hypothetical protein